MKNEIDYNKPSEIWFSVLATPEQLIQSSGGVEFIVRIKEEFVQNMKSINDIHEMLGNEYIVIQGLGLPGMFLVKQTTLDTVNTLNYNEKIDWFEINEEKEMWHGPVGPAEPILNIQTNDSLWGSLWGLNPSASSFHINVEELWNQGHTGSHNTGVAVVDSGISTTHPDLVDNRDFTLDRVCGRTDDQDSSTSGSHGTHCAGTIGAVGSNDIGVVGVCQRVTLFSHCMFCGGCSNASLATAFNRIALLGRNRVVASSNSWGLIDTSDIMPFSIQVAMLACANADIMTIAAAGNDAINYGSRIAGTWNFPNDGLITVAAMDRAGRAASFTNSGDFVHIAAPGVDIMSTVLGGSYEAWPGTSMACPHVTGAVALLRNMFPDASIQQIKSAIINSAAPTEAFRVGGNNPVVSGGRLDVAAAARLLGEVTPIPIGRVTVQNVDFDIIQENMHPAAGCGSNKTPTVSWTVEYDADGNCNDDNTTFELVMVDESEGSGLHWKLRNIPGNVRSVSFGNIHNAIVDQTNWPDLQNSDGYVGPFPPNRNIHRYAITITPITIQNNASAFSDTVSKFSISCPEVTKTPTPTITPTPSPTPFATPTPTPTIIPVYPNSANELYVSDPLGNVYGVDIRNKRRPKTIKDANDKIVGIQSSQGHARLAVRKASSGLNDYFWASNSRTGGFKTGVIYSAQTGNISSFATTSDTKLSYLVIRMNQKVVNLEHWFRDDSNIRLSFDTGSLAKFLQLDNVSVCPLKTDEDGYAREYLLSTTTSIPDYISYLSWYVACATNSSLNRYFSDEQDAITYQNILVNGGCSGAEIKGTTQNNPLFTAMPIATVINDRKDIHLQIVPKRGTAHGGGKTIANAYRPYHQISELGVSYKENDRYIYDVLTAGYNTARDIASIDSNNSAGLGRRRGTYTPCSSRTDVGFMSRARIGPDTLYRSAIKIIAGKYQTIAIDSNGDAYYTGNNNYGPLDYQLGDIIEATGGVVEESSGYRTHTFTANDIFRINSAPANAKYEVMIVGGGGGGGGNCGGGGGGGEYIQKTVHMPQGSYGIDIGAPGVGTLVDSSNGGTSRIRGSAGFSFDTISADGGGGGGSHNKGGLAGLPKDVNANGKDGANGGGASINYGYPEFFGFNNPQYQGAWPLAGSGKGIDSKVGGRSVQDQKSSLGMNTGGGAGTDGNGIGGDSSNSIRPDGGPGIISFDGKTYAAGGGGGDGSHDPASGGGAKYGDVSYVGEILGTVVGTGATKTYNNINIGTPDATRRLVVFGTVDYCGSNCTTASRIVGTQMQAVVDGVTYNFKRYGDLNYGYQLNNINYSVFYGREEVFISDPIPTGTIAQIKYINHPSGAITSAAFFNVLTTYGYTNTANLQETSQTSLSRTVNSAEIVLLFTRSSNFNYALSCHNSIGNACTIQNQRASKYYWFYNIGWYKNVNNNQQVRFYTAAAPSSEVLTTWKISLNPIPLKTANSVGAGVGGSANAGSGGVRMGGANDTRRRGSDAAVNSGCGGGGGALSGSGGRGGSGIVKVRYRVQQSNSDNDEFFTKIQVYDTATGLGPRNDPVSPLPPGVAKKDVNFVDAAIMTYNHQGLDQGDKSTYKVFLLSDTGELYTFGYDPVSSSEKDMYCYKYTGKLIQPTSPKPENTFPPDNITSISAGADHVVIIRHAGAYGMGSNLRGQLGMSKGVEYVPNFTKISGGGLFSKVACGPYHTLFLNPDGRVWSTGDNTCGQLGLGLNPNDSTNYHARYGLGLIETSYPAKDIFASSVADHYVYNAPTSGNKPSVRSRSNCGYVDVLGRLWVWGDRNYGQSGNLLSTSYNGGAYVADGIFMKSPVYVPYFYTAIRGSVQRNKDFITNIQPGYAPLVRVGYNINMNFLYSRTTTASTYNASNNETTFTVNNATGVISGMWIQIGDLRAWGTGADRGQVKYVSGNTIIVFGNFPIANNTDIAFKGFKQNTRITKVETNPDGTLKATVNSIASCDINSADTNGVGYIYYGLRPEIVDAGKDGIAVIDTAGRFIQWGVDKGLRGCGNIDKTTPFPLLSESLSTRDDYFDISYGLDHLAVIRKEQSAE